MAKFLFDFDGVLTDQTEEAGRVREIFRSGVMDLAKLSAGDTDLNLDKAEAAMNSEPWLHGWRVKGRVAAFADEDLFIRNNGLASCLDAWCADHEALSQIRKKVAAGGYVDFCALAQFAYEEMARETKQGAIEPIDPATATVLQEILDRGHSIVVVSNSGTDRIIRILSGCGLSPVAHAADPSALLRVRGGARKFELAEVSRNFSVGPYVIDVARPVYEEILREEKPVAVIGDVFSLDLALPLHLARTGVLPDLKLFLRTRGYTPSWSKEFVKNTKESNASFFLLNDLNNLGERLFD